MEYDYLIFKTHFMSLCEGSRKCILMPLTPLLYCYVTVLWQSSSASKEEMGIFSLDENDFAGVKSISEHIDYNKIKNTPKNISQKTEGG